MTLPPFWTQIPLTPRGLWLVLLLAAWGYGLYRSARRRSVWELHFFNAGGSGAMFGAMATIFLAQLGGQSSLAFALFILLAVPLAAVLEVAIAKRWNGSMIASGGKKGIVFLFPAREVIEGMIVGAVIAVASLWVAGTMPTVVVI
jgi:hypothetical protein